MKHTVFSAIQPSGQLHIGNYFGAIESWLQMQQDKNYDCIFGIVDLHALTEGPEPKELEQRIFDTAVDFLAAGLDSKTSIIMLQSFVPEHTDLAWILNCTTPISWLERVPTFKDKAEQFKNNLNVGLLDYPVLMAADILLYRSDTVPVGYDQLPHLELAREIVRSFNARYGNVLIEPKAKITPTPKLMSLTDPTKKMSKSLGPKSYIALADDEKTIEKKVMAMPTLTGDEKNIIDEFIKRNKEINEEFGKTKDTQPIIRTEEDLYNLGKKLGEQNFRKYMNVFNLYMLLYIFAEKKDRQKFVESLKNNAVQFSEYKKLLADKISNYPAFKEFRKKRTALEKNPKKIATTLKQGSQKARRKAQRNLLHIKKKIGLA